MSRLIDVTNEITYRLKEISRLETKQNTSGLTGEETNLLIYNQEEVETLRQEQKTIEGEINGVQGKEGVAQQGI